MVIFHSYVKLPEGNCYYSHLLLLLLVVVVVVVFSTIIFVTMFITSIIKKIERGQCFTILV